MKTKLITICSLAILLLITGSTVKANQIVDFLDYTDNQEPFPPGPNFFPGGILEGYYISNPDWGWTHTFSFEGPSPPSSIESAILEIKHYGYTVDKEHQIFLDGVSLGFLDDNDFPVPSAYTTTFVLDSTDITNLLDGTADIWMDIHFPNKVAIYWSRLTINYVPAGLDYIEITGPTEVDEDSGDQYTCTAYFIDSSTSDITNSATWSEDSDFASIDTDGFLTTSPVSSDESCEITATFGGKTDTYDITIKNVIPTVSIVADTPLAAEPGFNGIFGVSRIGSTKGTLRVFYDTAGSTATPGDDYMALSDYVDIPAGESSIAISVVVIDDDIEEGTETVQLELTTDPNYIIDPGFSSATVTIDDDEEGTPPEASGHIPAKGSFQVSRDTLIQLHITDAGSGVEYDNGPVTIHVNGDLIYDGANETSPGVYDSSFLHPTQAIKGICRRTGTETDYTFVFQASDLYDYEQEIEVEVYAKDKNGYEITDTYSFYTLMQTFGKNIKVNTDVGTLAQNHPDSAIDSEGNIWVVWEHAVITGDSDIYIGMLPEGGSAFEPSQLVFSDPDDQRKPAIAIDGDDTIYVVWQSKDSNGFRDIFVSTSINGTDWSNPVKVNSGDPDNESNQISPAIGIDGTGKVYIAWEDHSKGDLDKDIWAASSTDGINWDPELDDDPLNPNNQTEPSISIDLSDNTAYIFWTDERNATKDIYAAKSTSWIPGPLVSTNSNQWSPVGETPMGDPIGDIHLLWVDDYNGYDDIFYGKDDSDPPYEGTSIIDEPETFQSSPSMSIAVSGSKVYACWQDSRNVSGNADTDIYYTVKNDSDSDFGTNILVNDDIGTFTQTSPVIGTDMNGNPFMVWVDNREGNNDIYGTTITSTSSILRKTTVNYLFPTVQIVQINEYSDNIDDAEDVTIEIPAGALPVSTEIRISQLNNPPDPPEGALGVFYEFSPSGFEFLQPVTISIPHAAADCPGHASYTVYFYDPTILPPGSPWRQAGITNVEHLTASQDPTLPSDVHVVRFKTTHFTAFGVGGGAASPSPVVGGGGGGGGGGGCSVSAGGEGNIVEFLLPYIGFIIVLVILTVRDARVRKVRSR
ncbi:MAG: Calx-beta domain-containing protein [Planctomycetota bacterium]